MQLLVHEEREQHPVKRNGDVQRQPQWRPNPEDRCVSQFPDHRIRSLQNPEHSGLVEGSGAIPPRYCWNPSSSFWLRS
uniref:Uncharacterized protein n=1 Tax=Lepeophtheirus salmonis TaxID=72036 RepID=A0A0K2V883_LEPSM